MASEPSLPGAISAITYAPAKPYGNNRSKNGLQLGVRESVLSAFFHACRFASSGPRRQPTWRLTWRCFRRRSEHRHARVLIDQKRTRSPTALRDARRSQITDMAALLYNMHAGLGTET